MPSYSSRFVIEVQYPTTYSCLLTVLFVLIISNVTFVAFLHDSCHFSATSPDSPDVATTTVPWALVQKVTDSRQRSPTTRVVLVSLGTRPEAIKLAPVIFELRQRPKNFLCVVMSTGQHKEMLLQVLSVFGLQNSIDIELDSMR